MSSLPAREPTDGRDDFRVAMHASDLWCARDDHAVPDYTDSAWFPITHE